MRSPTRRNRNQGTKRRGYKRRVAYGVPSARGGFDGDALIGPRVVVESFVGPVSLVVCPTRSDAVHACTPADIESMLARLSLEWLAELRFVVLAQRTRKREVLGATWGRYFRSLRVGATTGPAIVLDAQPRSLEFHWGKRLDPDDQRELDRLRAAGHRVSDDGARWRIECTAESVRATQLFSTVLHELGHHVDVQRHRRGALAGLSELDEDGRLEAYRRRPAREREEFAWRFAAEQRSELEARRAIPFDRFEDGAQWTRWSIDPAWFAR